MAYNLPTYLTEEVSLEGWLTPDEAADVLDIHPSQVRRYIAANNFRRVLSVGKASLVDEGEVRKLKVYMQDGVNVGWNPLELYQAGDAKIMPTWQLLHHLERISADETEGWDYLLEELSPELIQRFEEMTIRDLTDLGELLERHDDLFEAAEKAVAAKRRKRNGKAKKK